MNRSIALVGRMGAGKSTVALQMRLRGYAHHSWAQGVRDIFSMAYDKITPENYAEVKERLYTVEWRGGPALLTGRELLQRIGTDAMREQIDRNFWIKAGLGRLEPTDEAGGGRPVVNDDTRFLNEAAALRERGFMIVRIVRNNIRPVGGEHPSEVEQEQIEPDLTVFNFGSKDDLARQINRLIPWYCPQCGHPDGEESKGYVGSVHYEREGAYTGAWWCRACNAEEMAGPCR
jgi:hypothetical protein